MLSTLRSHWPEYTIEGFALGCFMVSALAFTALFEHPASPLRLAVGSPTYRRALVAVAMGLTAIALVYSPWGRRSGAHMNPALTLAFARLGRVAAWDATFYVLAQVVGGLLGVVVVAAVLPEVVADRSVNYVVTIPGDAGVAVAFVAETVISFGLVATVLLTTARPRLAPWTGVCCGALVTFYVFVEAPLSGMSMNPARSLASALPSGTWTAFWIYLTAPTLGMLAAVEVHRLRGSAIGCAKLFHARGVRCIFCETRAARGTAEVSHAA